jgi:serine/threonine-protein kinase
MRICPRCSESFSDDTMSCPRDGAALKPIVDPLLGRTIGGRYRLIARLGAGGMSTVYLARHVIIDRLMAIKTLRRDLARDPVQRDRFLREARAVNRINHENIVEITDFGETDDELVYLVMEYVPGEPLLKTMEKGPMSSSRAIHIAKQVGAALARAHEMGVIHRDLKPENLLLVPRRERPDFVKVLDFGIAKIMDAPSLTGSQQIFGTPGYIAPEYIQSSNIDGRADLYSLGVILYELVTGALPFDYEYPGDLLVKHVTEAPIPPTTRLRTLETPMEALILKCLEKDPADRFRDAFHFLEELERTRELVGAPESWGGLREGGDHEPGWGPELEVDGSRARDTYVDGIPAARAPVAPVVVPVIDEDELATPDDTPKMQRKRAATAEYPRPSIPEPPVMAEVGMPVEARPVASSEPPEREPRRLDPKRDGICGVKRWRARYDALRHALDDIELGGAGSHEAAQAMAFAWRTLDTLETKVARAEAHQTRIEELDEEAKRFRGTLGTAIDELAAQLSQARGVLEELVARRNTLREKRDALTGKVKRGMAEESTADAILWELAAAEEKVRAEGSHADELEARLAELRLGLETQNEAVETELARVSEQLSTEMARIEAMAQSLRDPLDRVERFVLEPREDALDRQDPARPTPTG